MYEDSAEGDERTTTSTSVTKISTGNSIYVIPRGSNGAERKGRLEGGAISFVFLGS